MVAWAVCDTCEPLLAGLLSNVCDKLVRIGAWIGLTTLIGAWLRPNAFAAPAFEVQLFVKGGELNFVLVGYEKLIDDDWLLGRAF